MECVARRELPATRDIYAQTKLGKSLWLNVSTIVEPDPSSPRLALVHLFRDISRAKTLERGVLQLLAELPSANLQSAEKGTPCERAPLAPCPLTTRERDVLSLLASGSSTRTIADTLVISPATVRHHINHILAKLGVHSRLDAVALALREKLL